MVEHDIRVLGSPLDTTPSTRNPKAKLDMPIIQLENIWKAYGAHPVLNGITWKIEPGERIGLIGQNGCGKTTLFHILTGNLLPDQGRVHRSKTLDIGYLSQDPEFQPNITVLHAALEGFQALLDLQKKLGDLENRMGDGSTSPSRLFTSLSENGC